MQNERNMNVTKQTLKAEIEKTAKEANATELQIITAMQGECAKRGDENTLRVLCEIKRDYIK